MWQICMEHNFWITLKSPYESLDFLVRSLEVQCEGAPWICVWITDVLLENGFVFGKQFDAQSKLVLPQLQSRQGSTVCHSSLALHNAIYVFQKHRLSKQCQSFKSKVKGI